MIKFTKMHGLGNDFVVIDATKQPFVPNKGLIQRMADRNTGIGCDQLLLIEPAKNSDVDFNYRIFNADGEEVAQCGNGARCVARYIRDMGLKKGHEFVVSTKNRNLKLELHDDLVTVNMGVPSFEPEDIPFLAPERADAYEVEFEDATIEFGTLSLGNPHVVIRVKNVSVTPVNEVGSVFQEIEQFPEQVNVGFIEVVDAHHIRLRVYERGVGETLACGSGACAAVIVGVQQLWLHGKVQVDMPGGTLWVDWPGEGEEVELTGPAEFVYHGEWIE